MFRRLRNLWKLSELEIKTPKERKDMGNFFKQTLEHLHPSKQKLATILEDDPKEMFEEHNENV